MTGPARGRAAVVDVGSTSVHLLVADIIDGQLKPVADLSELLMFGGLIGSRGAFGSDGRADMARVLASYADEARRLKADPITFVGTDPLRHAADAGRACHEAEHATGIPVHVLDQVEEGGLTLVGVTDGSIEDPLTVIDIGGGSTEIIQAGPDGLTAIVGLPLGASRLSNAIGTADPPTAAQVIALRREADRLVARAPRLTVDDAVAVGGTAYGVARVATGPGVGERVIDADGIALAVAISSRERSEHVAELFGLNPRRARILPAGAAILAALSAHYGIDRIRASELGIREGLVRVTLEDPLGWRDRLGRFVRRRAA